MSLRIHDEVRRLGVLILLIALSYPRGLLVLLGEAEPPDAEEWGELLGHSRPEQAERVGGTQNTDGFFWKLAEGMDAAALIERCGGWGAITEATRSFRRGNPVDWNLFVEGIQARSSPLKSRLGGGEIEGVAARYGVSRKTVIRRMELVPAAIAMQAACCYSKALSREGGEVTGALSAEGDKR